MVQLLLEDIDQIIFVDTEAKDYVEIHKNLRDQKEFEEVGIFTKICDDGSYYCQRCSNAINSTNWAFEVRPSGELMFTGYYDEVGDDKYTLATDRANDSEVYFIDGVTEFTEELGKQIANTKSHLCVSFKHNPKLCPNCIIGGDSSKIIHSYKEELEIIRELMGEYMVIVQMLDGSYYTVQATDESKYRVSLYSPKLR